MEITLPLLNLRDKIQNMFIQNSLENSWTSNLGCIIETRRGRGDCSLISGVKYKPKYLITAVEHLT